jgi:nitrous oxidase accessory protein NosD
MENSFKTYAAILLCLAFAACVKNNPKISAAPTAVIIPDTANVGSNTALPGIRYKSSPPINLYGVHDTVITGLAIQNSQGICIHLQNCYNITIKNCSLGPASQTGVELLNCKNVTVESCFISNVSTGFYAELSSSIKFLHNSVKNIQGPYPKGAMVQYDNVTGTGNRVMFNRCENITGESHPEDAINMYESHGTAADPILIYGNWIRGGGPSESGGGILLGDNGGSYMVAANNLLVNPGNYGMAIAGGTDMALVNNKIYSVQTTVSNVGVYIWNQSNAGCSLNTISNNQVNWMRYTGEINDDYDNGNCGAVIGWNTNTWGAAIDAGILPLQF